MEIKDCNFHCPHCSDLLSSNGHIVLSTKRHNGEEGHIRLATTFGNYSYSHEPDTEFTEDGIESYSER
ncbi:MAG: hypothetical protein IPG07_16905 [Crocinitomicaceae bacterium]|nr:hypothetical protein [Crocinitomicaceae bacterium]